MYCIGRNCQDWMACKGAAAKVCRGVVMACRGVVIACHGAAAKDGNAIGCKGIDPNACGCISIGADWRGGAVWYIGCPNPEEPD
mmetsp:Transcript_11358/g.32512  ORF Transcript_11358/g.32512 Transcript_11358/m.32512 type:complete len:84 (-) Transcript_11358:999-1250(-)